MSRDDLPWIGLIVLLLAGGLLVGRQFMHPLSDRKEASDSAAFRQWLWESRSLDLAIQVGLIFVGALGIAALLPRSQFPEDPPAADKSSVDRWSADRLSTDALPADRASGDAQDGTP